MATFLKFSDPPCVNAYVKEKHDLYKWVYDDWPDGEPIFGTIEQPGLYGGLLPNQYNNNCYINDTPYQIDLSGKTTRPRRYGTFEGNNWYKFLSHRFKCLGNCFNYYCGVNSTLNDTQLNTLKNIGNWNFGTWTSILISPRHLVSTKHWIPDSFNNVTFNFILKNNVSVQKSATRLKINDSDILAADAVVWILDDPNGLSYEVQNNLIKVYNDYFDINDQETLNYLNSNFNNPNQNYRPLCFRIDGADRVIRGLSRFQNNSFFCQVKNLYDIYNDGYQIEDFSIYVGDSGSPEYCFDIINNNTIFLGLGAGPEYNMYVGDNLVRLQSELETYGYELKKINVNSIKLLNLFELQNPDQGDSGDGLPSNSSGVFLSNNNTSIARASISGSAIRNINAKKDKILNLESSLNLRPCDFDYDQDSSSQSAWTPCRVDWSAYSKNLMQYNTYVAGGNISYSIDIPNAGDYIFCIKISKKYGFSTLNNISFTIKSFASFVPDTSEASRIYGRPFSDDVINESISSVNLELRQDAEDSVWVCVEFTAIIPGVHTFSIGTGNETLDLLPLSVSNLFIEAVVACDKYIFDDSNLFLVNGVYMSMGVLKIFKVIDMPEDHVLSPQSYSVNQSTYDGKIFVKVLRKNDSNNQFNYADTYKWFGFNLSSFTSNDRKVFSLINSNLLISEDNLRDLSFIILEDFDKDVWSFSYTHDVLTTSGKTYIVNENGSLQLTKYNLFFELYSVDNKIKSYGTQADAVNFRSLNHVVIYPAEGRNVLFDDISSSDINIIEKENFILDQDISGNYYRLSLPERHQAFIIDHSGSMSWSDFSNSRFSIVNSTIDDFKSSYPGDVSYSITTIKGTPVIVNWFGGVESDIEDTGNPDSVRRAFLKGKFTNFSGIHIVRKAGSAPVSPTDGDIVFNGYDQVFYDTDLLENVDYYYALYPVDSNNRLGVPSIIKGRTRSSNFVRGIKSLSAKELVGSGVRRNDSAFMLIHMNEGDGRTIYDFSGNRINFKIDDSLLSSIAWIDSSEAPSTSVSSNLSKGYGLRFSGGSSYLGWSGNVQKVFDGLNFSAWIYPFNNVSYNGVVLFRMFSIIGIIEVKYFGQKIGFYINSIRVGLLNNVLVNDEWNHISIDVNEDLLNLNIYLDGVLSDSYPLNNFYSALFSILNNPITGIYIGGDGLLAGFSGKITEVSLICASKSADQILYEAENIPADNGDRLLVLNWFTALNNADHKIVIKYKQELGALRLLDQDIAGPANYGQYQGDASISIPPNTPPGQVPQSDLKARICFGDDIGPVSYLDGFTIYDSSIDGIADEWTFIDSFDPEISEREQFSVKVKGFRHFFRIFRINSDGLESPPEDSGMVEYLCKDFSESSIEDLVIGSVDNISSSAGNRKIRLDWNVPENANIDSIIVYYSDQPIPSGFLDAKVNSDAPIYSVFTGSYQSNNFTHFYGRVADSQRRSVSDPSFGGLIGGVFELDDDLENNRKAYYAVVCRDRYGRFGSPVFVDSTPQEDSNDVSIGPESIIAARCYGVDFESISIKWINPVGSNRFFDIVGWLDDNVILYFRITDIYGQRVDEQEDFELSFRFNDALNGLLAAPEYSGYTDVQAGPNPGGVTLFDVENRTPVVNNISFNEVVSFTQTKTADGWVKVLITTNNSRLVDKNYIKFAYTTASMKIVRNNNFGSDPQFSFTTQPIRIWLKHPLELSVTVEELVVYSPQRYLVQAVGDSALAICEYGDTSGNSNIGGEFYLPGAFINRKRPFTYEIRASYRGKPLPPGTSAGITVFEDFEGTVSLDPRDGVLSYNIPGGFQGVIGVNPELGIPASRLGLPGTFNAQQRESYPESTLIIPVNSSVNFINNATNTESIGFGQLRTPISKCFGRVFASLSVGEFKRSAGFYVCFNSSLYVRITASAPLPNGEDIARQYAYVYTIDPDRFFLTNDGLTAGNFSVENFAKPVPDGTIVNWRLDKLRNAKDRPFYSLTQSGAAGGVVDRTVSGLSSGVVFGPVSNVGATVINSGDNVYLIPEEYIISASVAYNGIAAVAASPVCIYPEETTPDQVLPSISQTSFYFAGKSFGYNEDNIQYLYADGSDFATFEVIRDPRLLLSESSDSRIRDIEIFCKCYNADGTNSGIDNAFMSILPANQLIEIKAIKLPDCYGEGLSPFFKGKIEILHGNNLETFIDADGVLQVRSSQSSLDEVVINTEDKNRSTIAIRSNCFIPFKWSKYQPNIFAADPGASDPSFCDASFWNEADIEASNPHVYLSGATSVIINNSERKIFSDGGKASGNPPKMIHFLEPLYLKLAYIKKNGVKLFDNFVDIDGESSYEIVFVAKFAGRPVPDSTPVRFYKCGSNSIILDKEIAYTETREETGFWSYSPTGELETTSASFVSVSISPLSSRYPIFGYVLAEINYDKTGDVFRQRVAGVDLFYSGNVTLGNEGNDSGASGNDNPFGGGSGGGGTNQPPGSDADSSLYPYPEIISEAEERSIRLFVNNAFTNTCYIFDADAVSESLKWRQIANMNLRRAMHRSEYVNSNLYAICGLSGYGSDPSSANATITITNSVEKWDLASNRWVGVSPASASRFASCSCNDGSRYIYVMGGFEARQGVVDIDGNIQNRLIPKVSRRVERYDTVLDSWESLCPMPVIDSSGSVINVNVEIDLEQEFSSSFTEYGVSFASAVISGNHIFVIGGARKTNPNLSVINYNEKVLVYSISENIWRVTDSVQSPLLEEFKRINPISWIDGDRIVMFGGSSSSIELEEAEFNGNEFIFETENKFSVQNCFDILISDLISSSPSMSSLRRADFRFAQLPKARDQASYAKLNNGNGYIFGGRVFGTEEKPGTNATRFSEKISINSSSRYEVASQIKPAFGRSASGYASDNQRIIFITGGLTTNQAPGFVRLEIAAYGEQTEQVNTEQLSVLERPDAVVRLDGYSGVDLKVEAYDDEGDLIPGSLNVELSGIITYGDGSDEFQGAGSLGSLGGDRTFNRRRKRKGTKIYPIIVSPRLLTCQNGVGYARVEGRSEDVLKSLEEIQEILNIDLEADQRLLGEFAGLDLRQGVVRFPYRISILGKVIDSNYFGSTSYVSSDSDSEVTSELFIPEFEVTDVIADAGQFGEAVLIPPMLPAFAGSSAPVSLLNIGPVLTASVSGVIGPLGDVDVFKFIPQKTGSYYITVEQKGFSTLKAKVKLFNSNFLPYYINETGVNEISFDNDGSALNANAERVNFIENFTYYIHVDTWAGPNDPETSAVGEYKLRLTLPLLASQNESDNGTGGDGTGGGTGGGGTGGGGTGGGGAGGGGAGGGGNVASTDILDYLSPEVLANFNVGELWFDLIRRFYDIYFRVLINNNAFNQEIINIAVANVSGLITCPFRCQSCRRGGSQEGVNSPTCYIRSGQSSEQIICSGSDNLECQRYYGNGVVFVGQSSSSSSQLSSSSSNSSLQGGFSSSSSSLDIPAPGNNEIIIEEITFDSINILASAIFGSNESSPLTEGESPLIQYYSDLDWIPSIESKIFLGSTAAEDAKLHVRKISQSIPFGSSPIYDGIEGAASLIKNNFDNDIILKNILLLSDNDENTSGNTPLQNAESINNIDGERRVKLNTININTFYPITVSALASRANMSGISPVVFSTGGQSFALFSTDFLSEALRFGFAGAAGSAGAGSLILEFDFSEQLIINDILPIIDIGTEDSVTYTASYSVNGEEYVEISSSADAGSSLGINAKCRFIKITFNDLIEFIEGNDYNQTPSLSKIRGLSINIAPTDESFIYSKLIKLKTTAQQCVIHIDWSGGEGSEVSAGVSLLDSGDWKDYERDSQPVVAGSGKVIIPIRNKDSFNLIKENLEQKSVYIYEIPHGSMSRNSVVKIYNNANDELVNEKYYDIDRDSGLVRFTSPQFNNSYYIQIEEEPLIKVGLKAKFGGSRDPIYINKFGFMINLSEDLSQINVNQPPVAIGVRISPIVIYPYSAITARYQYADTEGDVEDVEKRIIKWYKNGIEITDLLNQISFNDLHNPSDPTYSFFFTENYATIEANTGFNAELQAALASERLFSPGDQLYFTIQVHDGNQYSSIFRSRTLTVADYPAVPAALTLRSRYFPGGLPSPGLTGNQGVPVAVAGAITNEVSNRTTLFLDFDLFSQAVYNVTIVQWWVIDNANNEVLFKTGLISNRIALMEQLSPIEKAPLTNFEAVKIGHQIYAKLIIPANSAPGITQQVEIRSNAVTVTNVKPMCTGVRMNISNSTNGDIFMNVTYTVYDPDILQGDFIPGSTIVQNSSQSIIRLYKKATDDDDYVLDTRFITDPNLDLRTETINLRDYFAPRICIYVDCVPFDGAEYGAVLDSINGSIDEAFCIPDK